MSKKQLVNARTQAICRALTCTIVRLVIMVCNMSSQLIVMRQLMSLVMRKLVLKTAMVNRLLLLIPYVFGLFDRLM